MTTLKSSLVWNIPSRHVLADKKVLTGKERRFDAIMDGIAFNYRDGYRIEKMAESFVNTLVFRDMPLWFFVRMAAIKFLFIRRFSDVPAIKTNVFFSFPEWTERKDYLEICNYVMGQVDDKFFYKLSGMRLKPAFNFGHLLLAIRKSRKLPELGFVHKCYMAAVIYNSLMMIDEAERSLRIDTKKYVSFSCVLGAEHLLTQYFRKRGIPTYNLQHGVTYQYNKNLQDQLEYRNIISDHHLAWGDYTRDELIRSGFNNKKVYTAGYPRKLHAIPVRPPASGNCIVFLSRSYFDRANIECLEILLAFARNSNRKIHFHLKLHPSLDMNAYRKWVSDHNTTGLIDLLPAGNTLQDVLDTMQAGFCVIVNSSAYYESYVHGVVALRYNSVDFDLEHAVADDLFSNGAEFETRVTRVYESFSTYFPAAAISRQLQYVLGPAQDKYREILNA